MSEKSVGQSIGDRFARLTPEQREVLKSRVSHRQQTGFDLVAKSLKEVGVTHIYGVAGLPSEPILPACKKHGIRPIGVYHHTAAVCMATSHNYQAGKLTAVALLSAGPAITNAITGMLVAYENGWPVIVLSGRRSSFQKFDAIPVVRHVTKHAVDVSSTNSIRKSIKQSYHVAMAGRPGPAFLDLHEDVLNGTGVFQGEINEDCNNRCLQNPHPQIQSPSWVEHILELLDSASRPALVIGKGVRWSVDPKELQALVERYQIPFITSPMGRGFIPEDHSLCFNTGRTVLQGRADVVLVLGARLNWAFRHGNEFAPDAKVVRIDIHRDEPDDAVIESEFIQADAGDFVSQILQSEGRTSTNDDKEQREEWLVELQEAAQETNRLMAEKLNGDARPMSPYRLMKEIRDALPRDAICITEGNISMMSAQPVIPGYLPASRMDAGTNACMGVGIPFGIGAKISAPNRPVVVVAGDYGFSLSAMELEVCVRHNIPIVVVVVNNEGNNGGIKQTRYFPEEDSERVTMFQPGIEYDGLMKMFGGIGLTISDPDEVGPAMRKALEARQPTCLNVNVDPHVPIPNAWGDQAPIRRVKS